MIDDDWLIGNSYQLSSISFGCHQWVFLSLLEGKLPSNSEKKQSILLNQALYHM